MKKILMVLSLFLTLSANAAEIGSGKFNAKKNAIELNVVFGGGCEEHTFTLDVGGCLESMPVQCRKVKLVEDTHGDGCEALVHRTILLPLSEAGLDDDYYQGASLTIHGDNNTKVNITLP